MGDENAARLLDGRAWDEFCRGSPRRGAGRLPAAGARGAARRGLPLPARAGGLRDRAGRLQLADPDRPRFVRNPDSYAKWGAENADNQYLWARIRPDAGYRIRGQRESELRLPDRGEGRLHAARRGDELRDALRARSRARARRELRDPARRREARRLRGQLARAPSGRALRRHPPVLLRLGAREPGPLHDRAGRRGRPGASAHARAHGRAARRGGRVESRPRASGASGCASCARARSRTASRRRSASSAAPTTSTTATTGGSSPTGEALLIETEVPDARYWAFQLCDVWFRTIDYATRQTSLNHAQARRRGRALPLRDRAPRSGRAELARHRRASRGHDPVPLGLVAQPSRNRRCVGWPWPGSRACSPPGIRG